MRRGKTRTLAVMTGDERTSLVAAYIEHHTREVVRDEQNVFHERKGRDNHWAWEQMDKLCRNDPESCWALILEILTQTDLESVLGSLAAGPIEDLLARHGARFIDRVEERARLDPKFKDVLWGVWQSTTPATLWARVEAARGNAEEHAG